MHAGIAPSTLATACQLGAGPEGHVFVVHGDICQICADAVLYPT